MDTKTKTPNMEARMVAHRMEDRIRFGGDGNGIFLVVNVSRTGRPRWRMFDRLDVIRRSWDRGYLDLWITARDYELARDHFTTGIRY